MHAENNASYLNWRFGIEGRPLSEGPHAYVIRYSAGNSFMRNDDTDTLWWNITGDNWNLNFDEVTFALHLPDEAGSVNRLGRDMRFSHICYFVGKPERWNNGSYYCHYPNVSVSDNGHILSYRNTQHGEGVTAAYSWPAGLLASAPPPEREGWAARIGYNLARSFIPDPGALRVWLPAGLLAGWLLLYLLTHKPSAGRGLPSPASHPVLPAELTPGFAACALDHRYSATSFAADLLQLVARGAVYWEYRTGPVESNVLHILPENKVPIASLPHSLQLLLQCLRKQPDLRIDLNAPDYSAVQNIFLKMRGHYKRLARKSIFYGPPLPSLTAAVAAVGSFALGDGFGATMKFPVPAGMVVLAVGIFSLFCQPSFLKDAVTEIRRSGVPDSVSAMLLIRLFRYTLLNLLPISFLGLDVAEHMQPGTLGACFAIIYLNMICQTLLPEYSVAGEKTVVGINSLLLALQQQGKHPATSAVTVQGQDLWPYTLALRPDDPMTKSLIAQAGGFALSAGMEGDLDWSQICSLQLMVQAASCFTSDRDGSSGSTDYGGGGDGGGDGGGW